jgi:hypothetical protein
VVNGAGLQKTQQLGPTPINGVKIESFSMDPGVARISAEAGRTTVDISLGSVQKQRVLPLHSSWLTSSCWKMHF